MNWVNCRSSSLPWWQHHDHCQSYDNYALQHDGSLMPVFVGWFCKMYTVSCCKPAARKQLKQWMKGLCRHVRGLGFTSYISSCWQAVGLYQPCMPCFSLCVCVITFSALFSTSLNWIWSCSGKISVLYRVGQKSSSPNVILLKKWRSYRLFNMTTYRFVSIQISSLYNTNLIASLKQHS